MNLRTSKPFLITCGTITLLGVLLRLYFLPEPLWIDELHTAWVADGPASSIIGRSANGNQTPLYFTIVFVQCQLTGLTELFLRIPSLLFGTASIVVAAFVVWKLSNQLAATALTAAIVATNSWMIFWSVEARPYAMLQLLALLQLYALLKELHSSTNSNSINWEIVCLTALLPLIHLSAFVLIACQLCYAFFCLNSQIRTRIITSMGIGIAITVTATPILLQVISNRSDWSEFSRPRQLLDQLLPLLVSCLVAPLFALASVKIASQSTNNKTDQWKLVAFCSLGPILLAAFAGSAQLLPIATPRYLAASVIYLPVLAGLFVSQLQRFQSFTAVIAITLAVTLDPITKSLPMNKEIRFRNENWKSAVQRLNKIEGRNQTVFLFANLFEDRRIDENSSAAFREYLKFPMNSLYKLNNEAGLIAMPTLRVKNRWTRTNVELIDKQNGAQIIARVSEHDFAAIIDELNQLAVQQKIQLQISTESQPGNDIRLAFINIIR